MGIKDFYKFFFLSCLFISITFLIYKVELLKFPYFYLYRNLFFLPIILSGYFFGLNGSLSISLLASSLYFPLLLIQIQKRAPFSLDLFVTLILFLLIGLTFGKIIDKEREQKYLLTKLAEINRALKGILKIDKIIDEFLNQLFLIFKAKRITIIYKKEGFSKFFLKSKSEIEDKFLKNLILPKNSIAAYLLETGNQIYSPSLIKDPRFKISFLEFNSFIAVPLIFKNLKIGTISVERNQPFSLTDLNLLSALADQLTISIFNTRLYEFAILDGLTNLFTHRIFQKRLSYELNFSEKRPLSLIMADIDHFKKINDTYGHPEGDKILKKIATILTQEIKEGFVARYGGEEFVIILPNKAKREAFFIAEKLRKICERAPFYIQGRRIKVTLSFGVATFPLDAKDKSNLIKASDNAMYKAKKSGRNKVCLA